MSVERQLAWQDSLNMLLFLLNCRLSVSAGRSCVQGERRHDFVRIVQLNARLFQHAALTLCLWRTILNHITSHWTVFYIWPRCRVMLGNYVCAAKSLFVQLLCILFFFRCFKLLYIAFLLAFSRHWYALCTIVISRCTLYLWFCGLNAVTFSATFFEL